MDGDPFARIIEALRGEMPTIPLWMREGEVLSRDPVSVKVAGLKPPREQLMIDKHLKDTVARELSKGITQTLMPGSRVLMLTQDDQTFYIICEVVKA